MLDNNLHKEIVSKNGTVIVDIDNNSGFCFGVINAIKKAETELNKSPVLNCLGNIVHNEQEVNRLNIAGLKPISKNEFESLNNTKILFRAHGEPPASYKQAKHQNIEIIDATCPVVLKLQQRIKQAWLESKEHNGQIVIYGKKGHAEVLSLVGQTNGEAIVIENEEEINCINKDIPVVVFSQTTKSIEKYKQLSDKINERATAAVKIHDTICRQVANRAPKLKQFVKNYDLVFFVGGKKSSNAQYLYGICKSINPNTNFISSIHDIESIQLLNKHKIGICGATSTPMWLMQEVLNTIENKLTQNI